MRAVFYEHPRQGFPLSFAGTSESATMRRLSLTSQMAKVSDAGYVKGIDSLGVGCLVA